MTTRGERVALVRPAPAGAGAASVLDVLAAAGHARPVVALAQALAASPPTRTMADVVLGVREHPEPLLVFAGAIDAAAQARIAELADLLDEAATRLRLLTWADVEAACTRLADRLVARLGREQLRECAVVGIPRGGLVVAGLLAYALDLPRHRVGGNARGRTLLLVDDCVLSGVRLRQVLRTTDAARVVVAALCAHPDLCAAVEAAEPAVVACVAGVDLTDHGPRLHGGAHAAWQAQWAERVPDRYHTALLDLLGFPWSEPEVRLLNPVTEQVEAHWWLAPPDGCLQHRATAPSLQLQVADDHPGIERLAPQVVPVTRADRTLLVDTGPGRVVALTGAGAELWQAWMAGGAGRAAATVAARYDVPVERVADDLRDLLADLEARGLLAAGVSTG